MVVVVSLFRSLSHSNKDALGNASLLGPAAFSEGSNALSEGFDAVSRAVGSSGNRIVEERSCKARDVDVGNWEGTTTRSLSKADDSNDFGVNGVVDIGGGEQSTSTVSLARAKSFQASCTHEHIGS